MISIIFSATFTDSAKNRNCLKAIIILEVCTASVNNLHTMILHQFCFTDERVKKVRLYIVFRLFVSYTEIRNLIT